VSRRSRVEGGGRRIGALHREEAGEKEGNGGGNRRGDSGVGHI
jgi:hypothetical protein